jgi:hypothetical protein
LLRHRYTLIVVGNGIILSCPEQFTIAGKGDDGHGLRKWVISNKSENVPGSASMADEKKNDQKQSAQGGTGQNPVRLSHWSNS